MSKKVPPPQGAFQSIYNVEEKPVHLELSEFVVDEDLQIRVGGLNDEVVAAYQATVENGGELEPITVYDTGDRLVLAAGFHRVEAHKRALKSTISAYIVEGTEAEARIFAEEDNLANAYQLSTADKKNIFFKRLDRGHDWLQTSNRQIAKVLSVDHKTIGNWRADWEISTGENSPVERLASDGRVINVSGIQEANREREPDDTKTRLQDDAAQFRLDRKLANLVRQGVIQQEDTYIYKWEEVSEDPKDLRVRRIRGNLIFGGPQKMPSEEARRIHDQFKEKMEKVKPTLQEEEENIWRCPRGVSEESHALAIQLKYEFIGTIRKARQIRSIRSLRTCFTAEATQEILEEVLEFWDFIEGWVDQLEGQS